MQIEIWSDIACPFCYIGKRRFESALAEFPHRDQVNVVYKSFELDPNAPKQLPHDVYDMLSSKYGMSREQAIAMNKNLVQQAAEEGLDFQFDTLQLTNTFDAHRLQQFAKSRGKGAAVAELLFRAYFTDSKNVSDHSTLADLAAEADLDREEVLAMLASEQFIDEVREEEEDGSQLGIRGVPFYVLDRKLAVSGAQASSAFLGALNQAWEAHQPPLQVINSTNEGVCEDGSCVVEPPKA